MLLRQQDRRHCFVSSLVAFATGLIAAIWPLSAPVLHDASYAHNVLPLQDFITETLRRSKTSYSTLQVAMFYVVLLKDRLPKCDLTRDQSHLSTDRRAMLCGRRMFLSALMLASKFLQDRSYSTRAWGKITGLPAAEINLNELKFLQAVNWNLHVSKDKFERWSHTVIALSGPPKSTLSLFPHPSLVEMLGWKEVLGRLTSDCREDFSVFGDGPSVPRNPYPPADVHGMLTPPSSPPESTVGDQDDSSARAHGKGAPPPPLTERAGEHASSYPAPPPAPLQRNLPTPRGTPRPVHGPPRCAESSSAMAMLKLCPRPANRTLCPPPRPRAGQSVDPSKPSASHRRPSISSAGSAQSSPESLRSDLSTCHGRSRSSSVSSFASSVASSVAVGPFTTSAPEMLPSAPLVKPMTTDPSSVLKHDGSSRLRPEEYDAADTLLRFHVPSEDALDQDRVGLPCLKATQIETGKRWEPPQLPEHPLAQVAEGSRRKKKRTLSKADASECPGDGDGDVSSLVRQDLVGHHDRCPPMSFSDPSKPVSEKVTAARACKRSRSSDDQSSAVDVARRLLNHEWKCEVRPAGRYRARTDQRSSMAASIEQGASDAHAILA